MLHLVPPHGIQRLPSRYGIQTVAVGACNDGGVVRRLGPALDLQTVHAGGHQVVQMVDHAHIPAVHDVGTLLVLEHREVLAGALFLHQRILIAAGLGARAPVGVPPRHIVAQKAAPRIADAHGAVAERLQLQLRRHALPDGGDLRQTDLPRQHHPRGAQIVPRLGADVVGHGLLGADVALTVGRVPPRQRECPQIRQDQGVHPRRIQLFQMGGQRLRLVPARHGVHRGVYLHAVVVGKAHRPGQLLIREVAREGAHTKGRARQIDGVCAVQNCHLQLFPVPRWGQ